LSCCKAEDYKWCLDLPDDCKDVYKDDEGKKYCVFHAPQGEKRKSVEEFNKLVFERINQAITCNDPCDLSGTIFEGDINFKQFDEYKPLPHIIFVGATFTGETTFSYATFSWKADFSWAIFNKDTYFWGTTFTERAYFVSSEFREMAGFLWATFRGRTYFMWTKFNGRVNFSEATFSGESGEIIFREVKLIGNKDTKGVDFGSAKIKDKVIFKNVDLKRVSFLDTDLRRIDFINCTWHEKRRRYVLYDELELLKKIRDGDKETRDLLHRLWQRLKCEWNGFKKEEIENVEILYRRLKQKYKEERDEPMASIWHYGEKEAFRKKSRLRRFNPISLSNLYWLSSGYAERPVRAGIMLLLLIIGISILLPLSGPLKGWPYGIQEVKELTDIKDLRTLGVLILNTLQYATFQKEPYLEPVTLLGGYLKLLARILIPLQATLFALAVRNKLRR